MVMPQCNTTQLLSIYYLTIPPENSVLILPDCKCQETFPVWKLWLQAMTETAFIFIPTGAKSNFQLTDPVEDPSVRDMYT